MHYMWQTTTSSTVTNEVVSTLTSGPRNELTAWHATYWASWKMSRDTEATASFFPEICRTQSKPRMAKNDQGPKANRWICWSFIFVGSSDACIKRSNFDRGISQDRIRSLLYRGLCLIFLNHTTSYFLTAPWRFLIVRKKCHHNTSPSPGARARFVVPNDMAMGFIHGHRVIIARTPSGCRRPVFLIRIFLAPIRVIAGLMNSDLA